MKRARSATPPPEGDDDASVKIAHFVIDDVARIADIMNFACHKAPPKVLAEIEGGVILREQLARNARSFSSHRLRWIQTVAADAPLDVKVGKHLLTLTRRLKPVTTVDVAETLDVAVRSGGGFNAVNALCDAAEKYAQSTVRGGVRETVVMGVDSTLSPGDLVTIATTTQPPAFESVVAEGAAEIDAAMGRVAKPSASDLALDAARACVVRISGRAHTGRRTLVRALAARHGKDVIQIRLPREITTSFIIETITEHEDPARVVFVFMNADTMLDNSDVDMRLLADFFGTELCPSMSSTFFVFDAPTAVFSPEFERVLSARTVLQPLGLEQAKTMCRRFGGKAHEAALCDALPAKCALPAGVLKQALRAVHGVADGAEAVAKFREALDARTSAAPSSRAVDKLFN